MRKICYLPLLVASLILSGCGNQGKSIEEREENDPLMKTAHAFMDQGDWQQAVATLKDAMENEPLMARPHLDLATIYQQHIINYIHAIYHYDRYLELRPNSEKKELIDQQKLRVFEALANTLVKNSPQVQQVVTEAKRLQQENAALRKQLNTSTPSNGPVVATALKPVPTQSATQVIPKSATETVQAKHQIYHVVAGDNLSKISTRFYGESGKWDDIFQANKDRMKSPSDLRVGQTLVIPIP